MKRFSICLVLMAAAALASAASSVAWEGRAAVGASDSFPSGGNYAQSRVFAKGEIVEVYNTLNGKTSTVVITGATDLSGVLILLSPSAASELDVNGGYDTVVRISRKNDYVTEKTLTNVAPSSVADPDNNAAAAVKNDLVYTEERAPADYVAPPAPQVSATDAGANNVPVVEVTPAPAVTNPAPDSAVASATPAPAVANSAPATGTATPSAEQNPAPAAGAESEQPKKTVSAYEYSMLPPAKTENVSVVITAAPCTTAACACDRTCVCNTQPAPAAPSAVCNCPPAAASTPPLPPPTTEPSYVQPSGPVHNYSTLPYPELLITQYEWGKYYVQLGVFRDLSNLRNMVEKYRGRYPVCIKASEITSNAYELLIGPLYADEYTAVLNRFRNDGYKDAFVKSRK